MVMGQDWGGPIGMDIASRRPDRVDALVMGNTWCWPTDDRMMTLFSKAMGWAPTQWLIIQRNVFVVGLMRRTLQVSLTEEEFAHYTEVVPTPDSRAGIAEFPKQILDANPWLAELEERVEEHLADKPMLLIFGARTGPWPVSTRLLVGAACFRRPRTWTCPRPATTSRRTPRKPSSMPSGRSPPKPTDRARAPGGRHSGWAAAARNVAMVGSPVSLS